MVIEVRTIYENPDKQEKEQSFFNSFLSIRTDLNIKNPRRGTPPEPDYIFKLSQKKIGFEITSLVKEELAKVRTAQDKCLRKAKRLLEQKGLEPFEVQVQFRSDKDSIEIDKAAEELANFVKDKIQEINDEQPHHYHESGLKYSRYVIISSGTLNGNRWLTHHRFRRIHINWLSTNLIPKIQSRIDEKQEKHPGYITSCDECWLLIGVNEWTAPEAVEITEETKNYVFSGDFQRIFFLRNIENVLVEFKISRI